VRPGLTAPFAYRDFRLMWFGMIFGNIGVWVQFTAMGYYVAKLAPNVALGSFYIGLLGASRMIPVLLCSPIAGVVADRFPRKRTLLITNVLLTLLAIALALVIWLDRASLAVILAISAGFAATQSFDNPTRQSWVSLLVPRALVGNAIGLNSLAFNGPAVIGPPIAGLLISAIGVPACMAFNALASIWVVISIASMTPMPAKELGRASFVVAFREGIGFVFGHQALRWVMLMLVVTSLSTRSYIFLTPAYAVHSLALDAAGLGWLMGASGVGAMCGALAVAALHARRRSTLWFIALLLSTGGVFVLGLGHGFWMAAITLFVVGFGTQAFVGTSNILTQTLAPEHMRGRAMSVYTMLMLGLVPGGALLVGSLAMIFDLRWVFVVAGIFAVGVGTWTYAAHPRLRAT
jgi:MFS family permease